MGGVTYSVDTFMLCAAADKLKVVELAIKNGNRSTGSEHGVNKASAQLEEEDRAGKATLSNPTTRSEGTLART